MKYEVKYYVNEDKRTVVCTIDCSSYNAIDFVENKNILTMYYGGTNPKHTYEKALMPVKFIGIAKCSPHDKFDEIVGREIALNRAKARYDKAFNNCVLYLLRRQDEVRTYTARRLSDYNEKARYHREKRDHVINSYLNR